jgi:hypothetical protein
MQIRGEEIFWLAMKVGEIAASAAGDQDFLAQAIRVFEHGDAAAALAGFDSAHESCGASSENECIEGMGHGLVRGMAHM